jgi:hypothetical protein
MICGLYMLRFPDGSEYIGIRYDTLTLAAKAHDTSVGCVPNRALSRHWPNWSF